MSVTTCRREHVRDESQQVNCLVTASQVGEIDDILDLLLTGIHDEHDGGVDREDVRV